MKQLIYISTVTVNLEPGAVDDIVANANAANEPRGITGALAFNGSNFCQLLEGEADQVDDLVERIRRDPRHSGLKVIGEREVTQRSFADWSMYRVEGLDFSSILDVMKA